ncbi:FliM/FliN family flagellar motor switch protein [Ramlibacter tataouinensis]|uniref:Translocation protein in type III secretion-like protein n=1 Tax=Ramlibacter tataouinensis (strain ATCC BAA-407 / DSM 14655 / LMG 21543 / TTB310) TaxID=365046 RepID=F5Y6J9_RAMTT|nr:FliM/FliN family flagellar motor switch protein [Ramlibacter tataouinensis]AEG94073.1 translocation protein in type III secretion-like protein [Ramlibacter tataouinensis TTB310]
MNTASAISEPTLAAVLPRVERGVAAASRVLHDARLRAGWRRVLDGLEFVPLQGRPADAVRRVSFQTPHGPAAAFFSAPGFPSIDVGASHADAMPAPLRQLAAEALMQPVLEALGAVGLADVTVTGLATLEGRFDEVPAAGWVRLLRQGEPVASIALTQVPEAVLRGIVRRHLTRQATAGRARSLAMRGQVTLTTRGVRRSVLASLLPGDVLLLASGAEQQRVDCCVSFGARSASRWRAAVTLDETSLTIKGAGRMINEDNDAAPARNAAKAPHDIEVPVRFEIETAPVSLADIEAMANGYVIELATPLANARIRLVACGRVIGSAELVAVGDRLGARISHMAAEDAHRHVD